MASNIPTKEISKFCTYGENNDLTIAKFDVQGITKIAVLYQLQNSDLYGKNK